MRLKNFQDLVEECLTKSEMAEIERQVELELKALQSLQKYAEIGFQRKASSSLKGLSLIMDGE